MAFDPAVHKLLNYVLAINRMQSQNELMVELILAGLDEDREFVDRQKIRFLI